MRMILKYNVYAILAVPFCHSVMLHLCHNVLHS